VRRNVAELSRT